MSNIILVIFLSALSVRTYPAKFVGCYDGDTCTVQLLLGLNVTVEATLRLCDINAPEVTGVEKEAGIKTRDALNAFLRPTHELMIQVPQKSACWPGRELGCDKHDKYGRVLAYVLADGLVVNRWLVADGYAVPYGEGCVLP